MRTVIAITAFALSAAGAHAAEDRYGPPPAPSLVAVAGVAGSAQAARSLAPTPYAGPMLGWSGKAAPRAPTPVPTVAAARAVPVQPQAAAAPQQQAALPQSLYDRPIVPMSAGAPTPTAQPRLGASAADLPPPSRPQPPQRLSAQAGDTPRAYSVMREFGAAPDPTQLPPPVNYWATRPSTAPTEATTATIDGLFEPTSDATAGTDETDLSTGATAATRKLERRNQ